MTSAIVTTGIGKSFGDVQALRDLDLDVPEGAFFVLLGPSGAGKTTLVSLVSRLSDPTSGAVLVDGIDLRDMASPDLARHVAFVAQSTFVFEDTVHANVTLADEGDLHDTPARGVTGLPDVDGSPTEVVWFLDRPAASHL